MVTARRPGPASKLPPAQCAIAAANIRVLRQRNGWSQAYLGELMGWPTPSTVCAAEGHRGGRQRRCARWEIAQLAAIFGVPALQLLTRCSHQNESLFVQPGWPHGFSSCHIVSGPGPPRGLSGCSYLDNTPRRTAAVAVGVLTAVVSSVTMH